MTCSEALALLPAEHTTRHASNQFISRKCTQACAHLVHAIADTDVAALQRRAVAAVARAAVEEVGPASHAANAALITVKLLFADRVIKEVALQAHVAPKPYAAAAAGCCYWLPSVAQRADHFADLLAVHRVALGCVLQAASAGAAAVTARPIVCAGSAAELLVHSSCFAEGNDT